VGRGAVASGDKELEGRLERGGSDEGRSRRVGGGGRVVWALGSGEGMVSGGGSVRNEEEGAGQTGNKWGEAVRHLFKIRESYPDHSDKKSHPRKSQKIKTIPSEGSSTSLMLRIED